MQTCQRKNIKAPVKYHSASPPCVVLVWSGPQQGSGLSLTGPCSVLGVHHQRTWWFYFFMNYNQGKNLHEVVGMLRSSHVHSASRLFFFVFSFHPLTSVTKWEKLLALEIFLSCVYMEKIISFFSVDKCYIGFFSVHIEGFYKILSLVLSFILLFRYHFLKIPIFLTCTLLN